MLLRSLTTWGVLLSAIAILQNVPVAASEANLKIPDLGNVHFDIQGTSVSGLGLMYAGIVICLLGMVFGWIQYIQTKRLEVHRSMQEVSNLIWETCKTYLFQQGKFLAVLWILIAACIGYYFFFLQKMPAGSVLLILLSSVLGILGSYGVAWFGIRINTTAN